MSYRLLLATAAMAALWAWPAGALTLCPDEEGDYTPAACDLIWPFEPNPDRIECDDVEIYAGKADPICMEYWNRERDRQRPLANHMRAYLDRGFTKEEALEAWASKTPRGRRADDLCQAAWERMERFRVELGWRPGPKIRPHDPYELPEVCEAVLAMPEDEVRAVLEEFTEICGGDCRDLVPEE
jgi:hypothetical protein